MTRFLTRDRLFILAFLVPIALVIAALIYYPAIETLRDSFFNENLRVRKPAEFIGLDNYTRLLADQEFWDVTIRSIWLVLVVLPLEIIIAFAAALLLNERFPGRGLVRALVLIPWLVPPVVNGFLWGWVLNADVGAFNGLLYQFGLIGEYQSWLRDPTSQMIWVAIVQTWTRFAFPTIILLAGLQGIPDELYDAAKVDGANILHRLRHITIPSMRASIAIVLVIEFIAAFQIFDVVWTLTSGGSTGGGVNPFTKTLMVFNYELVFRDLRLGLGAALSYLILLMSLGVGLLFIFRLYNQGVEDKDEAQPMNRSRRLLKLTGIYVGCFVLLFWALAPIYWLVVSSISRRSDLYAAPEKVWFPSPPTLEHFETLLFGGSVFRGAESAGIGALLWSGLTNSLISSVSTALIVTLLCTGAGYVFARLKFRGKQVSFFYIMLMMPLPIWVALISLFFLMSQLGLIDTLPGLILIFVAFSIPLATWLMATFVRDIPVEIEEAGIIDGATRWQILRRLIIPLARPGMVAVFLVILLTTWNAFLIPLVFTRTGDSQTMTVVLTLFIGQYEVAWEAMAAAAVLTMLPPLLLALFFQRYLVRGMTLGAVKG